MVDKINILAGWRRSKTDHGVVLTMQLASSAEEFRNGRLRTLNLSMNDRQLRSLARDLTRAADERGLDLFARPSWWRFWKPRRLPSPSGR